MNFKKIICFIMIAPILFCGCSKKSESGDQKQLNVYLDVKDKASMNVLKMIIEDFQKKKPGMKVNLNTVMSSSMEEDITKSDSNIDVIFTNRNKMIELSKKGLLAELGPYYSKEKILEKYFNITGIYGRYNDKHYGMAILPGSIEMLYNEKSLKELGINKLESSEDLKNAMKILNSKSIKVPVVVGEDAGVVETVSSMIVNNSVEGTKLESSYDSGYQAYSKVSGMQEAFDAIHKLAAEGVVNSNTFEMGNERNIQMFGAGNTPIIIISSIYMKDFKDVKNVKSFEYLQGSKMGHDNVPVIDNCLLCTPSNMKNGDAASEFVKYVFSDEMQNKLNNNGYVTCNKKINGKITDKTTLSIIRHLEIANEGSVVYARNIPNKLNLAITNRIEKIIRGNHTGKEWQEILKEVYGE